MRRIRELCVALCLILTAVGVGHATTITYDLADLGGGRWEYTYTVTNDTLGVPLDEFTVYFAFDLYQNLAVTGTPSGWDGLAVEPADMPDSHEPGCYDALAPSGGLGVGQTIGGFSVSFDWLGVGSGPGSQSFDVVDPLTFAVIEPGTTPVSSTAPDPVPEPGTLLLLGSGLAALARARRRVG